jgi:hypothetical protein
MASVNAEQLYDFMNHEAFRANPEFGEKAKDIAVRMMELYQSMGAVHNPGEEN